MLCKPLAGNTIMLVPFDEVAKGRNPSWQYALVNKDDKMYKMTFDTEDEIIDSLFKAKEFWYGDEIYENKLYGKKDEMHIQYDLENSDTMLS